MEERRARILLVSVLTEKRCLEPIVRKVKLDLLDAENKGCSSELGTSVDQRASLADHCSVSGAGGSLTKRKASVRKV